ncbi:DUF2339 domain-containing protein [Sphingomonas sp. ASY06-1R]|uniref:DUF2339 domain-containing protein n=1 Tax=Sphingomonas sp. ASY06-1R TaxID=3445771 RepID=UPI003FA3298E
MILWGVFVGALLGWCIAGLEEWGVIVGGLLGIGAGWALRLVVRNEIAQTRGRLRLEIQQEVRNALELGLDLPTQPKPAPLTAERPVSQVARPAMPEPAYKADEPASDAANASVAAATPASPLVPRAPAPPGIVQTALSAAMAWLVGGNTIVRIGLLILFVGLSFLARYAAAAGLFPVELRLALVVAVGIALLVVGFRTRDRKREFSLLLQGAGIATIYLTVFAAARLFEVVPMLAAFALMVIVCAMSCALALLQKAQSLAATAFIGGFAVPLLLAGEGGSALTLFGYYTLLNLAVLAFAYLRSWRFVTLIGFFGTFGVATLWGLTSYAPADFPTAQFFLIVSVLIYVAAATFYTRNTPGPLGRVVDTTMLFGPALAGFGLEVGLVQHIPFGSAFAALGFAALYLVMAAILIKRGRTELRVLNEAMLTIGVGFVTLAIPLALGARWTSSAWAVEGAGAFWIGMRQARWMPRLFGMLLQAIAAFILLADPSVSSVALPFIDPAFVGAMLIALAALATAWWLRQPLPHSGSKWAVRYASIEQQLGKPAFLFGFAFWWLALAAEIRRVTPAAIAGGSALPVIPIVLQPLLMMLAYVGSAALFAEGGRKLRWPVATWPARVTLLPLVLAFCAQSLMQQHSLYAWHWPIWVVALAVHYWLLFREERQDAADRDPSLSLLHRGVHVGGVWLLAAMIADCLWLGIDRGALWNTSWAGVVFLVSAVSALLLLTLWAAAAPRDRGRGTRWPLQVHAIDYGWFAALPIAALAFLGSLGTALLASGATAPLPYIPLLNPIDLTLMLSVGVLLLWRRTVLAATPPVPGSGWLRGREALVALALLSFVILNTIWLRIAHHMIGVPWTGTALLESFVVQMGIAILWTLLALGLMLYAHRQSNRVMWLAGAGLLGLVVIKLLVVDLSNEGGAVRIVTFMVVGILMLVVGYFAPLPPKNAVRPIAEGAPA